MKIPAIDRLARLPQQTAGAPGLAALAQPRAPHDELELFAQALQAPQARPVLKPAGGAGALDTLSSYLQRNQRRVAGEMERVQVTRDPAAMLRITNELIDQGVQSDLIAKVIGKSVSAVDQLTKLN